MRLHYQVLENGELYLPNCRIWNERKKANGSGELYFS